MRRVDWTGWLKSNWTRTTNRRRHRRYAAERLPRPRYRDLASTAELLESRCLLAVVTWDGGGDGTQWSDPLNWSNDMLPGAADDVTIDFGGNTIQHSTDTNSIHSLTTTNPLTLAGGTLDVVTTLVVNNAFTLAGGTLKNATLSTADGGSILFTSLGGTLDGVTANSDLDLASNPSVGVRVVNGLTLNGTAYVGNAAGSSSGTMFFEGPQTLGGTGTVVLGKNASNTLSVSGSTYVGDGPSSDTFTIGSGITLRGSAGTLGTSSVYPIQLLNQGTIQADDSGGMTTFGYDQGFDSGYLTSTSATIDVSGVTDPAPQAVYQTARYAVYDNWQGFYQALVGCTLTGLTPNAEYTLRLHFAELDSAYGVGSRVFDVDVNGTTVLDDFDIVAAAGGVFKAVVRELTVTADASGHLRVESHHAYAQINGIELLSGTTVVQRINAGLVAGGTIAISPGSSPFVNQGQVSVSHGETLSLNGTWTNAAGATITATNAGLNLGQTNDSHPWSNSGTISVTDSTVNLGGLFTAAGLGTFERTRGMVNLVGVFNNTDATLALTAATGSWNLHGGYVLGGRYTASDGAKLIFTSLGGTLDGVTANSDLDLASNPSVGVRVVNGLTLNGTAYVGNAAGSSSGTMFFEGTQTLGGTGAVVLGKSSSNTLLVNGSTYVGDGPSSDTFTIGSGITLRGSAGTLGTSSVYPIQLLNQGTIQADDSGGVTTFGYDQGFDSGYLTSTSATIDVSGVTDPAPQAVYQTARYAVYDYWQGFYQTLVGCTLTGLTPNAEYTLRLHFAELDSAYGVGSRVFDVDVNGTTVLDDFDIVAAAGGVFKAVVRELTVTADASGHLRVESHHAYAQINGIELLSGTTVVQRINAGLVAGGTIAISPGSSPFVNQGQVSVSHGETLSLNGTWTNAAGATINAQAATLNLGESSDNSGSNSGTIAVGANSVVVIASPVAMADLGNFGIASSAVVTLRSHLTGNTYNRSLYSPRGVIYLAGGGSIDNPQLLEVMSADRGNVTSAFQHNFAYGTIVIASSTTVRLIDVSNNVAGEDFEALYVNSLVVPSGATLDLAGLVVYARSVQLEGTVVGGSIIQLADSGVLTERTVTPGSIANSGELDEWTFFGRAGRTIAVEVDPGSQLVTAPLAPTLGNVQVQLVDPAGQVLETTANGAPGTLATLSGIALPIDGNYRLRVRATAGSSTGNYTIAFYDSTIDHQRLDLNQRRFGQISNRFALDEWTFLATVGQNIRFDLLNTSMTGLQFDLRAPDGTAIFTGLEGDSNAFTVTASGNYTLTARPTRDVDVDYAFQIVGTSQTELIWGTPYVGNLFSDGQAQLFRVNVPQASVITLRLDDTDATHQNELYTKFGSLPTRSNYDNRFSNLGAAAQEILIPYAPAGTLYVLLYSPVVGSPGPFTLTASGNDVRIVGVSPDHYSTNATGSLTLTGAGFDASTTVALVAADTTTYPISNVVSDSHTQLTARFDLHEVPAGVYTVRVTKSNGSSDVLPNGFIVTEVGEPRLEVKLIVPEVLGRHATGTLYVEYANTGTVEMPGPLLSLRSTDPDDSDRPLLTFDLSRVTRDLVTNELPAGLSHSVSLPVVDVLVPGQKVRVPVYYTGLRQPWDFNDGVIELGVFAAIDDTEVPTVIDWSELRDSLRPDDVVPEAWNAVIANVETQTGPHWSDYNAMIRDNSQYLAQLGIPITSTDQLWSFELQQADGLSPLAELAGAVDAVVDTPSLGLFFGRSFGTTITSRYEMGPMGRGWTAPWQTRLHYTAREDSIVLTSSGSSSRRFLPVDVGGGPGAVGYTYYRDQSGEAATIHVDDPFFNGNGYLLQEFDASGHAVRTEFDRNGKLLSVTDHNGNRITVGYAADRLTTLTHSNGQSLTFTHNAAGLISSVTTSDGRGVTYAYDVANQHLLSVTTHDGRTTRYTYNTGNGLLHEHELLAIENPDGTHRFFTYDPEGRLESVSRDGNAERLTFTRNSTGKVTVTDASGGQAVLYFDDRGQFVRVDNPFGNSVRLTIDNNFNLTAITDPTGASQTFAFNNADNVTQFTDALGYSTNFSYIGSGRYMAAMTDARGNTTRFGYEGHGQNLTTTTYADGSVKRTSYDTVGNVNSTRNRRGQTINYQYDAGGRITRQTFPDGSHADFVYDTHGNLLTAMDANGMTDFEYDAADRLTMVTYPNGRFLTYAYDTAGRRSSLTDQGGFSTHYEYDTVGRLARLSDADGDTIVAYAYDLAGRLARKDQGNGTFATFEYDAAGQLLHLVNHAPDGSVNSRFDYQYDSLGRRVVMGTLDGTWTYSYDAIGQLTRAVFASTNFAIPDQDLTYQYDALGNRIQTIENGVTTAYAANNLNQYTTVGSATLHYDLDGNLISELGGTHDATYTYDIQNRLVQVVMSAGTWQYEYDVFGNRTATIHNGQRTEYLLDPTGLVNVVGEYDGSGNAIASYSHGMGLASRFDTSGTASYYDFDAIGSTAGVTDATGDYVNHYLYRPFGEQIASTEMVRNSFEFVGQFGVANEDNGLEFMRARYYHKSAARFTSPDPLGLGGGQINLYSYVGNGATNDTDPLGLTHVNFNPITEAGYPRIERALCPYDPSFCDHNPNQHQSPFVPGKPVDLQNPQNSRSFDPNQKLGPAGFGTSGFVSGNQLFPYRIDFENDATATAPAQLVEITDQLSTHLDWKTLEFTEVGFGDVLLSVPANSQHFEAIVPLNFNNQDFEVEILLNFNAATGYLFAQFVSVDPLTNLFPDVLTGFLPPEDGTGRGQGHFNYIIQPKPNLPTGTEITNIALIQFDSAEIIATNQIDPHDPSKGTDPAKEARNTIDAGSPTSSVLSLPEMSRASFLVSWSGSDDADGSGIGAYDIFVSDNGGAFAPWLTDTSDTSATYSGVSGHTYAFYSIAHDNVGHVESAPTSADATTTTSTNQPPNAQTGTLTTSVNNAASGTLIATDLDHDSLTYQIVSTANAHGTVSLGANGAFSYTPDRYFFGSASFTFKANDGSEDSNIATVSITVTGGVAVNLPNTPNRAFRVLRDGNRLAVWEVKPTSTTTRIGSVPFFTQTAINEAQVLRIEGGSQNDVVVIDPAFGKYFTGTLVFNGNEGNDKFDASAAKFPVVINGGIGGDTLIGGKANDSIDGGAGNDSLSGNEGQDVIHGGTGLDTIQGGAGGDMIFGGDDKDDLYGGGKSSSSNDGNDKIHGDGGDDLIKGGPGQDTLCGDADNDNVQGDTGNDKVLGGDGADVLNGNDGEDILLGGRGNDILYGGAQNDQLLGEENDDLIIGNQGHDRIDGGSGNDTLRGREGNDTLLGSSGNDKIAGGTGNDCLLGGGGNDYLHGGELPVSVYATPASDSIRGSDGNDIVYGGSDTDTLNGGNGTNALFQDGLETITDLFSFSIAQILSEC